jgi:hypothetical protein
MKHFILLPLIVCACLAVSALGQTPASKAHSFSGRVVDPSGLPLASANVYFAISKWRVKTAVTGWDGRFSIDLSPADYEITVNSTNSRTFKAFIHIAEEGLNPSDVTFIVDPDDACCRLADGSIYPKPISVPKPPFPPAARAVRAKGEVEVAVRVEADGKVSEVKAISGHPLLRAVSLQASRSAIFETMSGQRDLVLTYAFLDSSTDDTKTPRYKNLYRIEVEAPVSQIDY